MTSPTPYVVDVFGLRERRPGEPEQQQMSSEARWAKFEREQREAKVVKSRKEAA